MDGQEAFWLVKNPGLEVRILDIRILPSTTVLQFSPGATIFKCLC